MFYATDPDHLHKLREKLMVLEMAVESGENGQCCELAEQIVAGVMMLRDSSWLNGYKAGMEKILYERERCDRRQGDLRGAG